MARFQAWIRLPDCTDRREAERIAKARFGDCLIEVISTVEKDMIDEERETRRRNRRLRYADLEPSPETPLNLEAV